MKKLIATIVILTATGAVSAEQVIPPFQEHMNHALEAKQNALITANINTINFDSNSNSKVLEVKAISTVLHNYEHKKWVYTQEWQSDTIFRSVNYDLASDFLEDLGQQLNWL